MSRYFLKVRIKELAEEARIIRKEEARVAKQKKFLKGKQGREEEYAYACWLFKELKDHRKYVVGVAAREAQIAYAFLRGKKFSDIEKPISDYCKMTNLWKQCGRLIYKYGKTEFKPLPVLEETQKFKMSFFPEATYFSYDKFCEWINGAPINVQEK